MSKSKAILTYRAAKKKAWIEFSKYIRARDCLQSTGRSYFGKCITCGRIFEFELLHAGHFVGNRNSSILFDERNTHIQCSLCNCGLDGNKKAYETKMINLYGRETIDKLQIQAKQTKKYTINELEELASYYKEKTMELIEEQ